MFIECYVCGRRAEYDDRCVLRPAGWTLDRRKRPRCPKHQDSTGWRLTATLGELLQRKERG